MAAFLIVRSVVADPSERTAFSQWYGEDHMAEARDRFLPTRCWRTWSTIDPSVHYANYEFASIKDLNAMMAAPEFQAMVDDYSRRWAPQVTRSRDIVVTADD